MLDWISREARGKDVFLYVVGLLILSLIYILGAPQISRIIRFDLLVHGAGAARSFTSSFLVLLFFTMVGEEAVFRLPLIFLVQKRQSLQRVLLAGAVLSVVFGTLHGGFHHIFIQGVLGFAYCILFLKCGGFQGNYLKAFIVVAITHFVYDVLVFWIAVMQGAVLS